MKIENVHERTLCTTMVAAESLLQTLATSEDRLWPTAHWPAMRFDGGPRLGARGGHGPVAYAVERLDADRVVFRLLPMRGVGRGLIGWHGYELVPTNGGVRMRHVLEARSE